MLTPTYVNLHYWFYPIGNTPAVDLLEYQRLPCATAAGQEQQTVKNTDGERLGDDRKFEFTCCDIEPAVLARNVLLFAFICDNSDAFETSDQNISQAAAIWCIFYHFYVTNSHLDLLQKQADKLLQCSESLDVWLASPYGRFISFLSGDSLVEVRKCWALYAEIKSLDAAKKYERNTRNTIAAIHKKHIGDTLVLTGVRSAGAHWLNAMKTMSSSLKGYWEKGVVGGNQSDIHALTKDTNGRINPMFAISSAPTGAFAVHYGSDPLIGFHLADAFDGEMTEGERVDGAVHSAKLQFFNWCASLARFFKQERVHIRIHCGEAVRFCHELQSLHAPRSYFDLLREQYVRPWTSKLLVLDGLEDRPGPILFDVIDTSNLVDHVGPLNVLPAVAPLLSRRPSSVLYTESLLEASKDPVSSLSSMFFSDVTTISLVFGLSPIGHLVGITATPASSEALLYAAMPQETPKQRQYRMRVPWRVPELGDIQAWDMPDGKPNGRYQIEFDAQELADYFFDIYHKMFAAENMSSMMSTLMRQVTSPLAGDLRYYTRLNLVVLLHLAQKNIRTDWQECLDRFVARVSTDRQLIVGTNSLQELYMHLHTSGLWHSDVLRGNPRDVGALGGGSVRPVGEDKGYLGRDDNYVVVSVVLIVPRKKLSIFTTNPDTIGTPRLQMFVTHREAGFENSFFAFQCFFGHLKPDPSDAGECHVEEDPAGWMGSSDLIATCTVPKYMLLVGSRKGLSVGLRIDTNPSTMQFVKKLGLRMVVFECGLDDEKRLLVMSKSPRVTTSNRKATSLSQPADFGGYLSGIKRNKHFQHAAHVKLDKDFRPLHLQIHTSIAEDSDEGKSLRDAATVTAKADSPCTILLQIGDHKPPRRLVYPFPVNGSSLKTRIARKSSWIEVCAQTSPALSPGGYSCNPFPVAVEGDPSEPLAWSLPRVRLDRQPLVPIGRGAHFDWLGPHMSMTLSSTELALNRLGFGNRSSDGKGLLGLKESIQILFHSLVGLNPSCRGRHVNTFQLCLQSADNSTDTLIFVAGMHHDRTTGSVALDAFVLPVTHAHMPKIESVLPQYIRSQPLSVIASDDESRLWKRLLPALVERCRTSWAHKPRCEYRVRKRIPLSVEHSQSPICSCGEGKDIHSFRAAFSKRPECRVFERYVTRVAIAPLSAVAYVEPFGLDPAKSADAARAAGPRCDQCGAGGPEELKLCKACGRARYCGRECQKAAWPAHKKVCAKGGA